MQQEYFPRSTLHRFNNIRNEVETLQLNRESYLQANEAILCPCFGMYVHRIVFDEARHHVSINGYPVALLTEFHAIGL